MSLSCSLAYIQWRGEKESGRGDMEKGKEEFGKRNTMEGKRKRNDKTSDVEIVGIAERQPSGTDFKAKNSTLMWILRHAPQHLLTLPLRSVADTILRKCLLPVA